jgi:hypothetical protein
MLPTAGQAHPGWREPKKQISDEESQGKLPWNSAVGPGNPSFQGRFNRHAFPLLKPSKNENRNQIRSDVCA